MENSSFEEISNFFAFTEILSLNTNGSTSDNFKVRISGKWHFLKRPKKQFSTHPQYIAAFEKEFDVGYNLDHPNIVRYISKGRDKEGFYFLTEYVDGQTLKDFVAHNPDYFKSKEHAKKLIEQLLSATAYLHQKQILHLDLKPDNILITNIGHDVKIVDLGFVYTDCYQFLTTGRTNLYAAPEQINNGPIDQRTDIHGIGMILLYVFTRTSNKKALSKIPASHRPAIRKCLSNNIEDRYFDIASLKKDIAQSFENKPVKYWLLFLVVLCVGMFFLIKPYWEKEKVQDEAMVVSDTNKEDSKEIQDSIQEKLQLSETQAVSDANKEDSKEIQNNIQKKRQLSEVQVVPDANKEDSKEIQNSIQEKHQTSEIQNEPKTVANEKVDLSNYKTIIEKEIKGYFDIIYSTYSATDLTDKFNEMQQIYHNAVSASFNIVNTLHAENNQIPVNEVNYIIRHELNKNAATYLSWLMEYNEKQKVKPTYNGPLINVSSIKKTIQYPIEELKALPSNAALDCINWLSEYKKTQRNEPEEGVRPDSLKKAVQLLMKEEFDKIFLMELSPIDILDPDKYREINSNYKETVYFYGFWLSGSLSSTYPQLSIEELKPAKGWITKAIQENDIFLKKWLKEYAQKNRDEITSYAKENGMDIHYDAKKLMEE